MYGDVPIPLYVYRVQPQRPNNNATRGLYNDGATCLSCEHPRGRLSPARHGYFAKGFAPTRMVVQGRERVHVVEDCGAMQPRNTRVQDWRPKKKPPAQLRRGWGYAPRGLHRRRHRGWSRIPSGVLCESVGRVYAHRPRMFLSTDAGCLSALDLLIPVASMTSATNVALLTVATG